MITDLLEALTIFCFGLSWPISIRKSIISRTAKGKSLFFEVFLLIGYACGIARKIIQVAGGSDGFRRLTEAADSCSSSASSSMC